MAQLAAGLGVEVSAVMILDVHEGSVVVSFCLPPHMVRPSDPLPMLKQMQLEVQQGTFKCDWTLLRMDIFPPKKKALPPAPKQSKANPYWSLLQNKELMELLKLTAFCVVAFASTAAMVYLYNRYLVDRGAYQDGYRKLPRDVFMEDDK